MKRYRFPLAGVHRWRAHTERAARRHLGTTLADLGQHEQRLSLVRANLEMCRSEENGGADALAKALENGLQCVEAELQRRVDVALEAVEQARAFYRARRADLEALSRLADRSLERWRQDVLVEDQQDTEEMGRMAAHRRRRKRVAR